MPDDLERLQEQLDELESGQVLTDGEVAELIEEEAVDLLQFGPDDFGPYRSYLHTDGNELWSEEVDVWNLDQNPGVDSLTELNSYSGWYHIRNFGTQYETIIPTEHKDIEYDGPPLYTKRKWFEKYGLLEVLGALDAPVIKGCTNPNAWNYNPMADEDDGSCWVVPGYFLGQIPDQTMNNLHTTGGELILASNNQEYQGYYHVHGPGDLPTTSTGELITAGTIMAGRTFTGNNAVLLPVDPANRFLSYNAGEDVTELEGQSMRHWYDLIIADGIDTTSLGENLNNQSDITNFTAIVDTTTAGQNRDFIAFDNLVTAAESVAILEQTDYEFNHLIEDETKSPGIYGSKPKITSDLNTIEFSDDPGQAPPGENNLPVALNRDEVVGRE